MIIGFKKDSDIATDTGIVRGKVVLIPKGTLIRSSHPSRKDYISKKEIKVKVHHLLSGQNLPLDDKAYSNQVKDYSNKIGSLCLLGFNNLDGSILPRGLGASIPFLNPSVCWAGSSGYWCQVDINSVIVCN